MAMKAWDVVIGGKTVNTVFYDPDMDAATVRLSLIDHDGYGLNMTVVQATMWMTDVQALRELVTWSSYSNAIDNVPGETDQERAKYRRDVRRQVRAIIARIEASGDVARLVG